MSDAAGPRRGTRIPAGTRTHVYTTAAQVLAGQVATLEAMPAATAGRPLRIAFVIPPFGFGSGGHGVVFELARGLEQRGHVVSVWISDPHGEESATGGELRAAVCRDFTEIDGPVRLGFGDWPGTDVVVATGWQTVFPVMQLPGCRARAYLVNDYEPDFSARSVESLLAERTYGLGLPCIVGGGPWLSDLLRDRHGVETVARFPYPVNPALVPRPVVRRDDTLVVYGRDSTPRRAVGLGLVAVEELKRRRPELRVVLFGDQGMPQLEFAYEHLGRATPEELSWAYSEATVGLAFSLTHGSLVPHDMLACELAVVDLLGYGTAGEHRASDLVELVPAEPFAIADGVERLLDDPALRARRAAAGRAYATAHSWADATEAVEVGLYAIVRARSSHALVA